MPKKHLKTESYHHQLRATIYVFLLLSVVIFSIQAMSAETASILPKHVSRFRVVGIATGSVTDKINSDGHLESLTSGLNRSVTTAELAKANPQLKQLVDGLAQFGSGGEYYANNLVTANLYSNFQLQASQIMPCYEYGITDRLNFGIRIPVVRRTVHASFSAQSVNNAATAMKLARNSVPELQAGLAQVASMNFDTAFFADSIFTSKGYDVPHDFDNTALGDIEIGGKYQLHKSEFFVSSVQTGLRLPTGTRKSRTNIFDTGTGNGTWATGAYFFNDFYPNPKWTIGTAFKGIYNFRDRFLAAVPKDADDVLPSNNPADGQVQLVDRTSGMEYDGELSSTVQLFHDSIYPWIAYQWVQHGIDRYSGPGDLYYAGLENGTDYVKHAFEIGAGYTTIPQFVQKKVSVPYSIEALFNHTFAGRNTTYVSYVRVDLISYF